jgi:hypothetical protein
MDSLAPPSMTGPALATSALCFRGLVHPVPPAVILLLPAPRFTPCAGPVLPPSSQQATSAWALPVPLLSRCYQRPSLLFWSCYQESRSWPHPTCAAITNLVARIGRAAQQRPVNPNGADRGCIESGRGAFRDVAARQSVQSDDYFVRSAVS